MNGALISLLVVLSVIFIIICISALTKKKLSRVYASVESNAESMEATVREILWAMPDSDIAVITYGHDPEAEEVLRKLKKDYPQIRIIKK